MTKNQQQYAEYKDSGVEWLGEIPREWIPIRLKHLLLESLVYGANEAAEDDNPKNPRYIRITDMNSDGSLDSDTFRSLPMHVAENYLLKDGDILLARSGATVGKSFYYKSDFGICCFAGYLIRARPNKTKLSGKFAYWFFQSDSYWKYVAGSQIKATIQNVSAEKYGDLYLSLPKKIEEQTQIANFLDYETAKIDSLIEKQQQLIELLKEKRQAVISHAVTKGLDPNVPMKDSGVEWLRQVPEHWEVTRFSYEIFFQEGPGILAVDFHETGIPLLRIQNVKSHFVSNNYKTYLSPSKVLSKWDHYRVEKGDLIISCSASTGLVSEVDESTVGAIPYTGLIRLKPRTRKIISQYIKLLVQSDLFFEQIEVLQTGSTIQHFGPFHLQQMYISLPAINEQQIICYEVKNRLDSIDVLISKAESAIELIQERRTALISAAVTGKIDVRNWQNPTEAKMEFSA